MKHIAIILLLILLMGCKEGDKTIIFLIINKDVDTEDVTRGTAYLNYGKGYIHLNTDINSVISIKQITIEDWQFGTQCELTVYFYDEDEGRGAYQFNFKLNDDDVQEETLIFDKDHWLTVTTEIEVEL